MGSGVEKAAEVEVGVEEVEARVEVMHWMKNCHSTSAHRSCTESSSSAPWIVSAATTVTYLSRGTNTAQCISCRPPQAASTLTHQCMDLITDELWIGPNMTSSR